MIGGNSDDPLRAVIDAGPNDVQLVMIEGVPLYGDRNTMERFWSRASLEEIPLAGSVKVLASASAGIVFADVVGRLRAALAADGTSLAPLTETVGSRKNSSMLGSTPY